MAETTRGLEQELVELEQRYWQAMEDGDVEAVLRMTDDPCIVTGAQGVGRIDHEAYRKMMERPTWRIRGFRIEQPTVQVLGDDVAVLAYKVHEEMTVDGKPLTIDAADASTWVRRDGRWLCAVHTESILGDPYGRDRQG